MAQYVAEIRMFGGTFEPQGWAFCDGRLLPIANNEALFTILGTTYGGDGETTFALPDLRGRTPVHMGQGPGLTNRILGEKAGEETHTLTTNEMPTHTHGAGAASGVGTSPSPQNNVWAGSSNADNQYASSANTTMKAGAIQSVGGGQPHDNMPSYLAVNYIISLEGVFPSQS